MTKYVIPCPQCGALKGKYQGKICRKCYLENRKRLATGRKKALRKKVPCERCSGKNMKCATSKACKKCFRQFGDGDKTCRVCGNILIEENWRECDRKRNNYICGKCSYNTSGREYYEKTKYKYVNLRREVISAYGGVCNCCGESRDEFLSIDHVGNNGAIHRKKIGSGFYRWLKKNGFPKNDFQCLCMNCNFGKRMNGGVCPHVKLRKGENGHG